MFLRGHRPVSPSSPAAAKKVCRRACTDLRGLQRGAQAVVPCRPCCPATCPLRVRIWVGHPRKACRHRS